MRKLIFALLAFAFMSGSALAVEYTILAYDKDKKVLTLQAGAKEASGKLTDATKVKKVDKDGKESEGNLKGVEKLLANKDFKKGTFKIDAKIADGVITEIVVKAKK